MSRPWNSIADLRRVWLRKLSTLAGGVLGCLISGTSAQAYTGVVLYYPNQWEFSGGFCNTYSLWGNLADQIPRVGGGPIRLFVAENLTDNPPTWVEFRNALDECRTVVLNTHGYSNGASYTGLQFEVFASASARDAQYASYLNQYPAMYFTSSNNPPAIGITHEGIRQLLRPHLQESPQLFLGACGSCTGRDFWGDFDDPARGGTFFCYPGNAYVQEICRDLGLIIDIETCGLWHQDMVNALKEADAGSAYSGIISSLLLFGNERNRINLCRGCKAWAVTFEGVEAHQGRVRWVASAETAGSRYFVLGKRGEFAAAETLSVVAGAGSDAIGRVRPYEVAIEGAGYTQICVLEKDSLGRSTMSEWVPWSAAEDFPEIAEGTERPMSPAPDGPRGIFQIVGESELQPLPGVAANEASANGDAPGGQARAAGDGSAPQASSIAADVVVYTTTGSETMASHVWGNVLLTQKPDGTYYRASKFAGSANPADARDAYRAVRDANLLYNASVPPDPFPEFPLMILVGDGDSVGVHADYIVDPDAPALQGGWYTHSTITDVDGDLIPDGPISMVPVWTHAETQNHMNAVKQYRAGQNVDPSRSVVAFLGDVDGLGDAGDWFEDAMVPDFVNWASVLGRGYRGVLRESNFNHADPHWRESMKAAGTSILNLGVDQVWFSGLSTSEGNYTYFLEDDPANWASSYRWIFLGPTCRAGACWFGNYVGQARHIMHTNPLSKGICVGGIGQYNAGEMPMHQVYCDLLKAEMAASPNGTLLADVALRVTRQMIEKEPAFKNYALGISALGALVPVRGNPPTVDAPAIAGFTPQSLGLRSLADGRLLFSVPPGKRANLEVFDVRGRRLATLLKDAEVSEGVHSRTWDTSEVASGIYFAQLTSGGEASTAKIVIVK